MYQKDRKPVVMMTMTNYDQGGQQTGAGLPGRLEAQQNVAHNRAEHEHAHVSTYMHDP
jgi:hypothetical protein